MVWIKGFRFVTIFSFILIPGVFVINLEKIFQIVLMLPFLTLKKQMLAECCLIKPHKLRELEVHYWQNFFQLLNDSCLSLL